MLSAKIILAGHYEEVMQEEELHLLHKFTNVLKTRELNNYGLSCDDNWSANPECWTKAGLSLI